MGEAIMVTSRATEESRLRQHKGMLPFLFPSFAASHFDAEIPFTLEETRERLAKLARIRMRASGKPNVFISLLSNMSPFNAYRFNNITGLDPASAKAIAPIDVDMKMRDDDTYLYRVALHEERFRVLITGYLKRWEQESTVVTGSVRVVIAYLPLLLRSLLLGFVLLIGMTVLVLAVARFGLLLPSLQPLATRLNELVATIAQGTVSKIGVVAVLWLLAFMWVWFNDVVLGAAARRNHLLMRLEDVLWLRAAD
jgi:hypothetical protein